MRKKLKIFTAAILSAMLLAGSVPVTPSAATAKPAKTSVSKISTSAPTRVTLSWKKASGATSYKVYYRKSGTKTWKAIATVKGTSYTHKSSKKYPLKAGTAYQYRVRSYNSKTKKYGSYSATKTIRTQKSVPNKVSLTRATPSGYSRVNLTWKKTTGATGYKIYYRKAGSKTWKAIAMTTKTSYAHKSSGKNPIKDGTTYQYSVRAYNKYTKKYGPYSTARTVRIPTDADSEPGVPVTPVPETPAKPSNPSNNKPNGSTNTGSNNSNTGTTGGGTTQPKPETPATEQPKPAHKHSYQKTVITQPTCQSTGQALYACSCGHSYFEDIPVAEHKWEYFATNEATCQRNGDKVYMCSTCGKQKFETLPKVNGHKWQHHEAEGWNKPIYDSHIVCNQCGMDFTELYGGENNIDTIKAGDHCLDSNVCDNYSTKFIPVGEEWVETAPAYDDCVWCGTRK